MDELAAAYDENCLATIVRQKALLERAHAVITELLAYDARTMDLNKLSMLTGERTRESLAKAVISGRPNRIRWRRASRSGTLGCACTGAGTRFPPLPPGALPSATAYAVGHGHPAWCTRTRTRTSRPAGIRTRPASVCVRLDAPTHPPTHHPPGVAPSVDADGDRRCSWPWPARMAHTHMHTLFILQLDTPQACARSRADTDDVAVHEEACSAVRLQHLHGEELRRDARFAGNRGDPRQHQKRGQQGLQLSACRRCLALVRRQARRR